MTRFYETRIAALKAWADFTKRDIADIYGELTTDNFAGAYECKWQNNYDAGHVNLFCSLGDWACNITDLLRDDRFDRFYFEDAEESKVLFRHYTRIMLVLSELFTDFQDIFINSEKLPERDRKSTDAARSFYFPGEKPDSITRILNFINSVCKHKTQHVHICNNHFPIFFCDAGAADNANTCVSIDNPTSDKSKNAILVPTLDYFITCITNCYTKLDEYFSNEKPKFESLCKTFCN